MHGIAKYSSLLTLVRRATAPTLAQASAGRRPTLHVADSPDRTTTLVDHLGERVGQFQSFAASCVAWVRLISSAATQAVVEAAGDGADVALLIRAKGAGNTYIEPGTTGGYVELRDDTSAGVLRASVAGLGFYGHAPAAQPGAIANSTDVDAQIGGKINAILAALRSNGLIAT